MDDKLLSITNAALGAGGMGVLLVFALKWFVGDYFAKAKELREMEKKDVDSRITDLRSVAGELKADAKVIKLEVQAMKERILHTEQTMVRSAERLVFQAEKFDGLSKAFEGFVKTTGERLTVVEAQADQVIRIGQMMAARLKGQKPGKE